MRILVSVGCQKRGRAVESTCTFGRVLQTAAEKSTWAPGEVVGIGDSYEWKIESLPKSVIRIQGNLKPGLPVTEDLVEWM